MLMTPSRCLRKSGLVTKPKLNVVTIWKILILLLALAKISLAREPLVPLPDPDFSKLSQGDFAERNEVQLSVIPWIANDPEHATEILLGLYHGSKSPEVRARLFDLLERAYFPTVYRRSPR